MEKKFLCIILSLISLVASKNTLPFRKTAILPASLINTVAEEAFQSENFTLQDEINTTNNTICLAQNTKNAVNISAKSAYLMDFSTKTTLFAVNEEEKLPIASMCKIMTLLLTFEDIKLGNSTLEDKVYVSKNASSMGGSQAFLRENEEYFLGDLIKSIVISSANDSCVAIAEKISGTTDVFVEKMNQKASELGMNHTVFTNCTGLPKPGQFSCAKDVAIMMAELLNHPEYFKFSTIWMDKINHKDGTYTELTNTNKLIRALEGCDGGKTGYTAEAKYCISSTAMRDNLRLISVIIGAKDSATRFKENSDLLQYGFANFKNEKILSCDTISSIQCPVKNGKEKSVSVRPQQEIFLLSSRTDKPDVRFETTFYKSVKAPLAKGQEVGTIIAYQNGVEVGQTQLLAATSVEKKTFKDIFKEIAQNFSGKKQA